jgi:ubiquinone/menaquinone biosynthesis C-methylase UbiE
MEDTSLVRPYDGFSLVYDRMMKHVNYKRWTAFIVAALKRLGYPKGFVLDMGCGTGTISLLLFEDGYKPVGLDLSIGMIRKAREKSIQAGVSIPFLQGDMRSLPFRERSFDVVLSLYDSMNYMLEKEDLRKVFQEVRRVLKKGGVFIFDLATEWNIIRNFDGRTFSEEHDDFSYIWTNEYDRSMRIVCSRLVFSIKEGARTRRFVEIHRQRMYDVMEVAKVLEGSGFVLHGIFDNFYPKLYNVKSDRAVFVSSVGIST